MTKPENTKPPRKTEYDLRNPEDVELLSKMIRASGMPEGRRTFTMKPHASKKAPK